MRVHKFGGSSLADAKCFKQVSDIILRINPVNVVIVSATYQTTNQLIELTKEENLNKSDELLNKIKERHLTIIKELGIKEEYPFLDYFSKHSEEIKALLQSIHILKERTPSQIIEIISGYGELWSSFILSQYIKDAKQIDARTFLTLNPDETINYDESKKNLLPQIEEDKIHIITGYWARDEYGVPTTLKRNGSDYSAAIVGNLLDAEAVNIWTDVSGVCSADPRIVNNAVYLKSLSYDEAIELAHFGAKVIHPKTMVPLMQKDISIFIKNTFQPKDIGTEIKRDALNGHIVKGFTVMDDVALFNIEGSALVGLPGTASKIFSILKDNNISVILITQGSSEYSISFVVNEADAPKAQESLFENFSNEISKGKLKSITYQIDIAILAAVGDKMSHHVGVSGKIFSSLASSSVNIKAIAQGSSERNISIVINKKDISLALNTLHDTYFKEKLFNIFIIGVGGIGTELHKIINKSSNDKLNLVGFCNSKKMILEKAEPNALSVAGEPIDLEKAIEYMNQNCFGSNVIVDCTSNEKIAQKYIYWMNKGFHVVTPNKKANTSTISYYRQLFNHPGSYKYETTVGAGLPVINTLKSLIDSGDNVQKIEATLSGTLSFIFNNLGDRNFSEVIEEAYKAGYTEPDPRDDLSGMDVARKALILAREIGLELDLSDIKVESLFNEEMAELSIEDFIKELPQLDEKINSLKRKNCKLSYIASISDKGIVVKLSTVDKNNSFYNLSGTDNMVIFTTDRYNQNPLVIKGPGAGIEVTAAGVLSDIIQISKEVKND